MEFQNYEGVSNTHGVSMDERDPLIIISSKKGRACEGWYEVLTAIEELKYEVKV